jgi:uncharacterized protein YjiS (DUF1127 family)
MSETLLSSVRPATTNRYGAFSRLLNAFCSGIVGYFGRRAAIKSLGELDDRALRDIGLVRSQIEAAVSGFVALSRSGEDVRMACSAPAGPRVNGRRRASTGEATPWS